MCGCYFSNVYLTLIFLAVLSTAGVAAAFFAGIFSPAIDPSSSAAPIQISGSTYLEKASGSQLFFLEKVLPDGTTIPAGRSYDNLDWEGEITGAYTSTLSAQATVQLTHN